MSDHIPSKPAAHWRWFSDPVFARHDAGPGHPERPARLAAIERGLADRDDLHLDRRPCPPAGEDDLLRIHSPAHVEAVLSTRGHPRRFDADTATSADSVEAALRAAGAGMAAVDAVVETPATPAFVAARPPGHHAEPQRVMGFCLFNNIAVAAAHAAAVHGLQRILIFDPDVHHGNGTQAAFWQDPGVLFTSWHQWPWYPGSGNVEELGGGPGRGRTLNVPMAAGAGDAEYLALAVAMLPALIGQFEPELVLVSAGFDAHADDPLGGMELTDRGFVGIYSVLFAACQARKTPLVLMLEGGYDLGVLERTVPALLAAWSDPRLPATTAPLPPALHAVLRRLSEGSDFDFSLS